jgi:hypothetical protein
MTTFLKSVWRRRWFRVCAWSAVSLLTLLILLRQYIDWSGTRHMIAVQQMLAAQGETLDFRQVVPAPIPDARNFCAIPILKDLPLAPNRDNFDDSQPSRNRARLKAAWLPNPPFPRPNIYNAVSLGIPIDLREEANWFRKSPSVHFPPDSGNPARDILSYLSKNDPIVTELASGLDRPDAQWTPPWKTRPLPDAYFQIGFSEYPITQGLCAMLDLRAVAAAQAGDPATAHQALLISLRLDQANLGEPFIIASVLAAGLARPEDNVVWELCRLHSGSAGDFRTLQAELARFDFHASLLFAVRSEMAGAANTVAYLKRARDISIFVWDGTRPPSGNNLLPISLRLLPDGAYDGQGATLLQSEFDYIVRPLRDAGFPEALAAGGQLTLLLDQHKHDPSTLLTRLAIPSTGYFVRNIAYIQSITNQAIAACALERYRIEHGAYPDALSQANHPGEPPIPDDPLTRKPMGYRKTPNGRYTLWSLAFNGINHNGQRILDPKAPDHTKFSDPAYQGDWVWDFPAE